LSSRAKSTKDWNPTLKDPIIIEYIRERVGEEGLVVAELIEKRQPVQGVEILETIQDKPSNVRKTLYKLEDARVAEYQKDTDKSGWETFLWRLTLHEVKHQINKERKRMLANLEEQVQIERENSFYICPDNHERTIFDRALKLEFKCPDCGQAMNFVDNRDRLRELEEAIQHLKELVFD
jgi:transcription initiation factor TFIIE subunit alpha